VTIEEIFCNIKPFVFSIHRGFFLHHTAEMDAYVESMHSFDYANDVRSLIDRLDLAVDRKNLDVWFPLRRGLAKSFRSSPELTTDSPVYHQVAKTASLPVPPAVRTTAELDDHTETSKSPQRYSPFLIDALDLAVDHRITAAVGIQQRRKREVNFRSSVELSVHSPVYGAAVRTVPPEASGILKNPARSDHRRSVWNRSKRFIWKSMVNAARRICFCHSFVDLE